MKRSVHCAVALGALLLLVAGCEREERQFHPSPNSTTAMASISISDLQPGNPPPGPETGIPEEYSAFDVSEGQRLFNWYNCSGCHSHGGGGMGPPLMDNRWIYGSEPANIYSTIIQGRPNGMPSWRGKIPDYQVWQIVAYVRSMSGLVAKNERPSRQDEYSDKPPANRPPQIPLENQPEPKPKGEKPH
jgi:cytochrome c oxidase cbb3-type subunit 3